MKIVLAFGALLISSMAFSQVKAGQVETSLDTQKNQLRFIVKGEAAKSLYDFLAKKSAPRDAVSCLYVFHQGISCARQDGPPEAEAYVCGWSLDADVHVVDALSGLCLPPAGMGVTN